MKTETVNSHPTYHITGMDCADCARTIERGVARLNQVDSAEMNFTLETLRVSGNVSQEDVIERVRVLGYNVLEAKEIAARNQPRAADKTDNFLAFMWNRSETRFALLASILVLPGLIFHELLPGLGVHHVSIDVASALAMVLAGYPVAVSGWRAFRINRQVTINALMTIAAIGALVIGAYTEAGVVMVLFAIGEAMEGFTAERARNAIRSLLSVSPEKALLLYNHDDHQHEKTVNVVDLKIGDRILVKPGALIPMDGEVLAGISGVDQSSITGESRMIEKNPGDRVFASSMNGEGTLEIRVTALVGDNTISRMIQLVEEAQEKRAPAQAFVDRFAAVYTPIVVALAAAVILIPPLFFGQPLLSGEEGWLYRGLALLVVACPCALVISTPVTIISAISNAARNGVLLKGGAHLETLSRVRAVAFDKTGTLTEGRPVVMSIRASNCSDPEGICTPCKDLLGLASAIEQRSEHPIANAIIHEARHQGVGFLYPAAESVTAIAGRGISGAISGQKVTIGSHAWFDVNIPHSAHCDEVAAADESGLTTMLISKASNYQGYIAVADRVRDSSRKAIAELKDLGIKTIMLTGDNEATAAKVAKESGIDAYKANCLPEEKLAAIENLRQDYSDVAMVGDGINDTPALAASSVGIAVGTETGATTQAMETADVTLLGGNLLQLPFIVRLSRAAMRTIRFNVGLSIGIKLFFLVLVMAGYGSMWLAVLGDMGTSLVVTLNGMRMLKKGGLA